MDPNEGFRLQRFLDDDFEKVNSRLPARALHTQRRRWRIIGVALVTALCSAALIALLVNLHYLLPQPNPYYDLLPGIDQLSCDLTIPNNNSIENAFMINLRSAGHLSFSQAKLIDVTWDLFIGQGGRLLMAWASYRAYMDELVCLMETTAVSYELYNYLVFDTTSLLTTWKSTKALFLSKDWRSRMFLLWFGLATLYTLAFPTLMQDGTLVTAESNQLVNCIPVWSGALIGLQNGTLVTGPPASQSGPEMALYDGSTLYSNASNYQILLGCKCHNFPFLITTLLIFIATRLLFLLFERRTMRPS